MRYRLDEGALEDLEEATRFYFQEDPEVELRFTECIDSALEQVTTRPNSWPILELGVRRYVVDIFPYSLLYTVAADHVLILAVAHHSRRPEYWKERIN